jgi:hypothetical protein
MFRMSILEAQVHANQQMERLGCLCTHAAAGTNVYAAKTNDEIWMSVDYASRHVVFPARKSLLGNRPFPLLFHYVDGIL